MKINSISDIGSTRQENQDNFWSALLKVDNEETGVVCMCDGMGGLDNGALASKIVVEAVRTSILDGTALYNLRDLLLNANKTIYNLSNAGNRMGTTCTVLCCRNGEYYIHHIGDSRCYLISNNTITLLTKDHSVINEYGITKENNEELYRKYKSKLTRCIGVKEDTVIDVYKGNYTDGDIFLLCSDGFWHYFEDSGYNLNLSDLRASINQCMKYGETDNISVSLLYT